MNTFFFVLTATAGVGVQALERTVTGELVAGPEDTQATLYEAAKVQWSATMNRTLDRSFTVSYWSLVRNELP